MSKYLFLALISSILFFSCAAQRSLTQEESEKIYSYKVQISKPELKTKILVFINEGFKSSKSVIQTSEDGLITGNYDAFLAYGDVLKTIPYSCTMTFMIKYTDNEVKLKLTVKDIYSKGYSIYPDYWGGYAKEIKAQFDDFDQSLANYLSKKDTF